MNAEYINLFIEAAGNVFREMAQINLELGNKSMRTNAFYEKNVAVLIGITGQLSGSVTLSMDSEYAKKVASVMMCGMPVEEFDEMAQSAVREMVNMMMGQVAALIEKKGKIIDITPPTLMTGSGLSISNQISPTLVLGFNDEFTKSVIDLDIAVKEA